MPKTEAPTTGANVFRVAFDQGLVDAIVVGDDIVTWEDLTFREQQSVRANLRAILEDTDAQLGDGALMDLVPAMGQVVHTRVGNAIDLDAALDYQHEEVKGEELDKLLAKAGKAARPTEGADAAAPAAS